MALEITDNNFKEILAEGSPVVGLLGILVRALLQRDSCSEGPL